MFLYVVFAYVLTAFSKVYTFQNVFYSTVFKCTTEIKKSRQFRRL